MARAPKPSVDSNGGPFECQGRLTPWWLCSTSRSGSPIGVTHASATLASALRQWAEPCAETSPALAGRYARPPHSVRVPRLPDATGRASGSSCYWLARREHLHRLPPPILPHSTNNTPTQTLTRAGPIVLRCRVAHNPSESLHGDRSSDRDTLLRT